MKLSAIDSIKKELRIVQANINDCIDESGFIINVSKYDYQFWTRKARDYKECIDYLQKMQDEENEQILKLETLKYDTMLNKLNDDQLDEEFTKHIGEPQDYFVFQDNNHRKGKIIKLSEKFHIKKSQELGLL